MADQANHSAGAGLIIDCHAHIIDPARFPFAGGPGYRPKSHETGTAEAYVALLDRHKVGHAVLVQPSGYGTDNAAMLDAVAAHPGRFKAIAMVAPEASEISLRDLAEVGVVGVRFNLVSYRSDALNGATAERLLARMKALGWHAQIYADDAQWPEVAAILRKAGVKVLVDHFGVREPAAGIAAPGFQAVLALGRDGLAAVKLSSPFRVAEARSGAHPLDPFAAALIEAYGLDACVWGSDWPFLGIASPPSYDEAIDWLARWVPDSDDRKRVLWRTPARLFGFGA